MRRSTHERRTAYLTAELAVERYFAAVFRALAEQYRAELDAHASSASPVGLPAAPTRMLS